MAQPTKFYNFSKNFKNINDVLQQYTIDLLKFSFQKQVIEINLSDYQTRLTFIKEKASQDSQLGFLEEFSNLATKKYLLQITKDIENMQLGLKLLEDTINTIRSRIEVEKAERDRNFQELVAILGVGVVTVSLVSDPAKDFCSSEKEYKDFFPKIPYYCEYPFSFSVALGIIFSLMAWWLRKRLL
ncbi:MAG: hypothetical protein N4J56_002911 [Chroococcidiopsis sp. SAG 2025]|uniref:hypothetical protein n=1 Tax=Chroococcidiopsis sp. SAG 2025 TaxID=171389 RepID=UPI002937202D|nr:hypothetical protein [Chroococcidiopsis sp. SAG 2025]MDV2993257.1 hypothetical protein [Chroococcidiopsis sp. SAG 2025]